MAVSCKILEGEERAVRELYTRIASDPRHRNARLMLDREVPCRAFPEWSMGFERPCMDDPETAGMFGVAREAIHGRLSPGTGRIVAMMLQTFYAVQQSDLPLNFITGVRAVRRGTRELSDGREILTALNYASSPQVPVPHRIVVRLKQQRRIAMGL
jgi:hypothetical protein